MQRSASAGLDAGKAPAAPGSAGSTGHSAGRGKPPERLRVAPVQHVRCGATANGGHEGNVCDSVPFFEEALSKAVRENPDCAPKANEQGTVNYVLTVDFKRKSMHLFPGASGQWRGKQARRAVNCVKRAFVSPDWSNTQHQYRFYTIAVLATYLPANAPPGAPAAPGACAAQSAGHAELRISASLAVLGVWALNLENCCSNSNFAVCDLFGPGLRVVDRASVAA